MAGGLGMRLRPLTQILPKPLLPLGEESIIETMIKKLKSQGLTDFILATNYKSNIFENYLGDGSKLGVSITYSREEEALGTAGPLSLIKKHLTEPFIVINGDILTNLDFNKLVEHHKKNNAMLTLTTKNIMTPLHYGVVETDKSIVKSLKEKPKLFSKILTGIYCIDPKIFDFLPFNKNFLMTDLINILIKNNQVVIDFSLDNYYWLDIGQMDHYEKAKKDFENGLLENE